MRDRTIPATSINAVTLGAGATTGASINLEEVMTEHACQAIVVATAANDQAGVHLEGSLDGSNWYSLGTAGIPAGGAPGAGTFTALIAGTGAALFVRTSAPAGSSAGTPTLTTLLTSG